MPTNVLGITDNLKNFTLLLVVFFACLFVCFFFFANSKRERDHLYSVNLNIHGC